MKISDFVRLCTSKIMALKADPENLAKQACGIRARYHYYAHLFAPQVQIYFKPTRLLIFFFNKKILFVEYFFVIVFCFPFVFHDLIIHHLLCKITSD